MPEPKPKKKMVDVVRRRSEKSAQNLKKVQEEKINEAVKKIDRQFEQFEKNQEKKFKEEEKIEKRTRLKLRKGGIYALVGLGGLVVVLAGVFFAINALFVKAEINIETKKTEWNFIDSISADKKIIQIGATEISNKQIPAEVFSITKNFTFSFLAAGKKNVQQKAEGIITVYNATTTSAQTLIATTRLMAPDGKIFRLKEKITIPAAKSRTSPSSVDAEVIADKPGAEYNIGPQSKFTVPGLQGTSRYASIYGSSKEAMKNGFIGERAYPTDDDIKKGKTEAEKQLKDYTDSELSLQIPQDFKFLDGSRQFNIVKENVNAQTDEKGNFSIYVEGKSSSIGFKEADLLGLLEKIAQAETKDSLLKIKTYTLEYGAARPDFVQGRISFAANFKGVFEEPIDINDFKQKVSGKTEQELRALTLNYPNIQKFSLSVWPTWVKNVPEDIDRIVIKIN